MPQPTKERFYELLNIADQVIHNQTTAMYKHLVPDDKWYDDNRVPVVTGLGRPVTTARDQRTADFIQYNRNNLLGMQGMTGATQGSNNTMIGYINRIAQRFHPVDEPDYTPIPKYHEPSEIEKNRVHETTVIIKTRKINHIIEDIHV